MHGLWHQKIHTVHTHRVYRVPGFLSSRPNWVLPNTSTARVLLLPPLSPRGQTVTYAYGRGGGGPNSEERDRHPGTPYYNPSPIHSNDFSLRITQRRKDSRSYLIITRMSKRLQRLTFLFSPTYIYSEYASKFVVTWVTTNARKTAISASTGQDQNPLENTQLLFINL